LEIFKLIFHQYREFLDSQVCRRLMVGKHLFTLSFKKKPMNSQKHSTIIKYNPRIQKKNLKEKRSFLDSGIVIVIIIVLWFEKNQIFSWKPTLLYQHVQLNICIKNKI
jgi:hypothetical protein